jgi:sugar phosphate isomerase/epimerase
MHLAKLIVMVLLLAAVPAPAAEPNPFYAFDNIALKGPEPVEQKLDELKSLGYAGLSLSGTNVGQIRSTISLAEARGLKLHALYVGMPLGADALQVPENMDAVFEAVGGHGTIVWIHIQAKDKAWKPSDPAGDAVAVPALRALADRAARHQVKLALYPHTWFWAQSTADCIRIAKAVDRPNLGISFNLCHALKMGEEERIGELLDEAKPHLFMVTVNGADAGLGTKGGWDRLIQPVGRGTYDLAPLLRQVRSLGYTGAIGFQGYAIEGQRQAILRESMEAWRKIAASAGN